MMEVDIKCQLEFGYFEQKIKHLYLSSDCVELPSSWPIQRYAGKKTIASVKDALMFNQHKSLDGVDESILSEHLRASELMEFNGHVKSDSCNVTNLAQMNCQTEYNEIEEQTSNHNLPESEDLVPSKLVCSNAEDTAAPMQDQSSDFKSIFTGAPDDHSVNEVVGVHAASDKANDIQTNNREVAAVNRCAPRFVPVVSGSASPLPKKSWAGLFHTNSSPSAYTSNVPSLNGYHEEPVLPTAVESKVTKKKNLVSKPSTKFTRKEPITRTLPKVFTLVKPEDDPNAKLLAEKLLKIELIFKPQALIPRGLINTSNWCYINATLQALIACPPFYQLLKGLSCIKSEGHEQTSTPILDCFIEFASEFHPLSSKRGYQSNKDVRHGPPFVPSGVYEMLSVINSSLSDYDSQEDAEEFLSSMLNGMHEEIMQIFTYPGVNEVSSPTQPEPEISGEFDLVAMNGETGDNEIAEDWEEVIATKRNRSAVTRRADSSKTPISTIFRGELCTSVLRERQKASISYEPFFCLPLDVPTDHTGSIEKALLELTGKEKFSENDSDLDAFRQQTIEVLPPVLIFHLKRFVYDKSGGSKKIDKKMDFKTDLVIGKDMLSKAAKKYSLAQRSYKLFAIVYHHGERSTGGHYTTDVFHIGVSSWLRIDDKKIWPVSYNDVTRHSSNRTPYLLYYRRTDLG